MASRYLLFLLLQLLPLFQAQEDLQLSVKTSEVSLKQGESRKYKVKIPASSAPSHLVISAAPVGQDLSDPDIYISNKTYPTNAQYDYACTAFGQDVCVVPPSEVFSEELFYVTIFCEFACRYTLTASLQSTIQLREGERFGDTLYKDETKIFEFLYLPQQSSASMKVFLDLHSADGSTNDVVMKVTMSKEANYSNPVSLKVFPTWMGLATFAQNGDPAYCSGCYYQISVTAKEDVDYSLFYVSSSGFTKLKEIDVDVFDFARLGRNCYEYNVRQDKSSDDLIISLKAFSGEPSIYVNPGQMRNNLEEFLWNATGLLEGSLVIDAKQRGDKSMPIGLYYVCVASAFASSYTMSIRMQSPDELKNKPINLVQGQTQMMSVDKKKMIVFQYSLEDIHEMTKLRFNLVSLQGNADLYLKLCKLQINEFGVPNAACTLTKSNKDDEDVDKSKQLSSFDSIVKLYDPTDCQGSQMKCFYLIGVYGVNKTRFSLSILGSEQVEVQLIERVPYFGIIKLKEQLYFSIHIEDPATDSLKIQLTSLSGDADMYSSRSIPFCNQTNSEKQSNHDYLLPDTIMYTLQQDGSLQGTYHITLVGFTHATYSLTYTTAASQSQRERPKIILVDGVPQQGSLNSTEITALEYQFAVDFPEQSQEDIRLFLTSISGTYNVYVKAGSPPKKDDKTWSFDNYDGSLLISANDPKYVRSGTYYVMVVKKDSQDNYAHVFIIKYITGLNIITVNEDVPEMGNLSRGDYGYYRYLIANLRGNLTITVTPLAGDPDLYISMNPNNKMPSNTLYDRNSAMFGADSISIGAEEIVRVNPKCNPEQLLIGSECAIYISVLCQSDECTYTLQATRSSSSSSRLIDGIPQFDTVYRGKPKHYLFSPASSGNSTFITANPQMGRVKIYADLLKSAGHAHSDLMQFPTPENHQLESARRDPSDVLFVKKATWEQCGHDCIFAISVYADLPDVFIPELQPRSDYTIVATSHVGQIAEGDLAVDFVDEGQYKYYRFNVPCTSCVLTISLTPLSEGDPDLYVNRGLTLPTREANHFKSTAYRGDYLQISQENDFFKNNTIAFKGDYIIGVYGAKNNTYSLAVSTSASLFQDMSLGIPTYIHALAGERKYFLFYSWNKQSIKVKLNIHQGRAEIRANAVDDIKERNPLQYLPTNDSKATWSSLRDATVGYLLIDSSHAHFNASAVYIIGVESITETIYEIMVEYVNSTSSATYLRAAEPYAFSMQSSESQILAFVANKRESIVISINTRSAISPGNVEASVSRSINGEAIWKIPQNSYYIIRSTDPNYFIGTYFIKLTAASAVSGSIYVEHGSQFLWLSEGVPQRIRLSKERRVVLYFRVSDEAFRASNTVNVNINVKYSNMSLTPTMDAKKVDLGSRIIPDFSNSDPLDIDRMPGQMSASISFTSSEKPRVLVISINPQIPSTVPDTELVALDVTMWTSGVLVLTPYQPIISSFSSKNDQHIYEVPAARLPGRLGVEVVPCYGEVEFFTAANLNSINNPAVYEDTVSEMKQGRLYKTLENSEIGQFVIVKPVALLNNNTNKRYNGAKYTIRTLIPTGMTKVENYKLDNYGVITGSLSGPEITLSWGKVISKEGNVPAESVTYDVYMSDEGATNMATVCGIMVGDAKRVATNITESSVTIDTMKERGEGKHGGLLVFNVIANIPDIALNLAYTPMQISQAVSRRMRLFGYFIIFLIIALALLAIYFYCRMKQRESQIGVEQKDSRNTGRISTSREMQSTSGAGNYVNLKLEAQNEMV